MSQKEPFTHLDDGNTGWRRSYWPGWRIPFPKQTKD